MTNTPEARTSTGEIIDQGTVTPALETPPVEPPKESAPAVVPEKYEFTLPEGQTLDPEVLASATPVFKELGLTQDAAQKLVDVYNKQVGSIKDSAIKAVETMRTEWRDSIKADKDIGSILESKVLPEIGRLKDKLPPDVRTAFNEAMDFTGAGDNPAIVKALYKIAELVNEGSHISGGGPSKHGQTPTGQTAKPTIAAAMYPNLPHA